MKMEIKLTVEIDPEATHNPNLRGFPIPNPVQPMIVRELNDTLRHWASSNPCSLLDPEHLSIRLEVAPPCNCHNLRHFVAEELRASLRQLQEVTRIVEVKAP